MASASQTAAARPPLTFTGRNGLLDRYFYFAMSLVAAAAVVAGFSQTVGDRLFHPAVAPPTLIWLHGAVFSAWILFYVLQSALVRTHNVRWHRTLGWAGAGLAAVMFPLGLATGVVMVHFETYQLHIPDRYSFLAIPFFDISSFALCIGLALWWRKKPELHRRLIFLGTCALLVAAFARVDHAYFRTHNLMYLPVDLLIILGMGRDLLVNRRVHTIYRVALPVYFVAQMLVLYLWRVGPVWWVRIAHALAG